MSKSVENIKPYNDDEAKTSQVEAMFDSIAPAYDFMNHAMTMGIDRCWRRKAIRRLAKIAPRQLLDVATGTGDFAISLCRKLKPQRVIGIDLSAGMLQVAEEKIKKKQLHDKIAVEQGDCLNMRFIDESFDAVTVAFGVRNFEHLDKGYSQMYRVLRPGGMVCVLELSTPRNRIIRWFYDLYTLHIIPFFGKLKSGDKNAYRYLPLSIAAVPQGDDMLAIMREAGFTQCNAKRLTLGTCTIYTAVK
ncbi:MAG: bifunctional demethylmenaquinone methyltransferase/2-methoxy-6-polyprenyl-1,4-benzoquinol methylase UbiE [Muribaculaceae bacterium]|nr:bifunctional demethylmenaquinone methyltransferase/2-methoxy-6-polyprenyl-1,4-benzoquinol methylase UbiE [Muribaculaceae bacterium]